LPRRAEGVGCLLGYIWREVGYFSLLYAKPRGAVKILLREPNNFRDSWHNTTGGVGGNVLMRLFADFKAFIFLPIDII